MKRVGFALAVFLSVVSAASAADNGNQGVWTANQIDKLCYQRAAGNAEQFDSCVKRNNFKIGKPKQAGEIGELNLADKKLTRKALEKQAAAEKAAKSNTDQPSEDESK